jgi:hypothetical protein
VCEGEGEGDNDAEQSRAEKRRLPPVPLGKHAGLWYFEVCGVVCGISRGEGGVR